MDDLITLITESEMISIPELCARLHTSKEMILARLERYEQLGYIKRVIERDGVAQSGGCTCNCKSCKGCAGAGGTGKPLVYWTKGERLL